MSISSTAIYEAPLHDDLQIEHSNYKKYMTTVNATDVGSARDPFLCFLNNIVWKIGVQYYLKHRIINSLLCRTKINISIFTFILILTTYTHHEQPNSIS